MDEYMQYEGEEWRPIAGFHYEVSNHGRVRRTTAASGTRVGFILKHNIGPEGYARVSLRERTATGMRNVPRMVHLFVLEAFKGARPRGHNTNHINGDKTDNRIENLEWVTRSQNQIHAYRLGLQQRGSKAGRAKLTEDQVLAIREGYGGVSGEQTRLAREYGVAQNLISKIVRGEVWTHVGGPIAESRNKNTGREHGRSKLTDRSVRRIRERAENGALYDDLARDYGVCISTISNVARGKRWKHVK